MEAPPGIGPGMKVLQTSALPLGYGAVGILVYYTTSNPFCQVLFENFRKKFLALFRPPRFPFELGAYRLAAGDSMVQSTVSE